MTETADWRLKCRTDERTEVHLPVMQKTDERTESDRGFGAAVRSLSGRPLACSEYARSGRGTVPQVEES